MPKQKIENRELVKDKLFRMMMTKKDFVQLTELAVIHKITRAEVVRRGIARDIKEASK